MELKEYIPQIRPDAAGAGEQDHVRRCCRSTPPRIPAGSTSCAGTAPTGAGQGVARTTSRTVMPIAGEVHMHRVGLWQTEDRPAQRGRAHVGLPRSEGRARRPAPSWPRSRPGRTSSASPSPASPHMQAIVSCPARHFPPCASPAMTDPEARKVIEMGYGGSERLTMNMGPQHPSAHGVFRAILTLEGETVVGSGRGDRLSPPLSREARRDADLHPVPVHRVQDRLRGGDDQRAGLRARGREIVGKIEVPKRAQYLARDRGRAPAHRLALPLARAPGAWTWAARSAAGATVFLYCIREREAVLDLFESLVGARLLYGFHQVGGTRYDLPGRVDPEVPRDGGPRSSGGHRRVRGHARGQRRSSWPAPRAWA